MSKHYNEKVASRLSKLEGQIRGIKEMLVSDSECRDILIQISAASSALSSVAKIIVSDHITHCVADALKSGETGAVADLDTVLNLFIKLK